jgi:phage tail sheath protein FI
MAFQVSPGVQVREIDLTNVVPAVSTSVGASVGNFTWGPVEEPTTITSEKDLANVFGVPTATSAVDFFTSAYFLKYANNLKVVRAVDSNARNANTDDATTATVVKNADDYANQVFASSVTVTVDGAHTIGDTVVDVTDASNLTVGDVVTGTGIASGTTISSIAGDAITLSAAITGNLADGATLSVAVNKGRWIAKYPGSLGNSLAISVCAQTSTNAAFTAWSYKSNFSAAPGTSDYAASVGGSNDELHIVVIDEDGAWTGTSGTILETFAFVSQAADAKTNDGASNYYKDVINNQSKYIWWGSHPSELTNAGAAAAGQTFANSVTGGNTTIDDSLVGGVDSGTLGTAEIQSGFDLVEDAETVDVSLLIMPSVSSANAVTVAQDLISIAEARKDCVAFVSPAVTATTSSLTPKDDVIAFADQLTSSSYAVIDSTSLKIYDKYNDQYINIPASSSVAGLCANTDNVADAWFSPAGYTRGQLRGVTKINFNPKKAERDELYLARVNPIVTFPGEGTVLFGDKTAQAKPSAFDRINVRRLFIVLEKAIATAAKYQLFEFNDEFTRAQFRNLVEPFLREVKGRRGLTDFQVVCDETNNTGDVIDRNEFVADIYIKPARSINFISLNFIATRTGVEFSEIIGQ